MSQSLKDGFLLPEEMSFVLPTETLSWPKLLIVRLFAHRQFMAQRRLALQMFGEALHSAFLSVAVAVQQGDHAHERLKVLEFMLEHVEEVLSAKKRFILGRKNIRATQREAACRYVHKLQAIVSTMKSRNAPARKVLVLMNNLAFTSGGRNENAT